MASQDGLVVGILRKVGGLLSGLANQGVQQIELDRDGGVQHLKWSDPNLKDILEQERDVVSQATVTGFRGEISRPRQLVIDSDEDQAA